MTKTTAHMTEYNYATGEYSRPEITGYQLWIDGVCVIIHKVGNKWQGTDAITGMMFGCESFKTRREAIEYVKNGFDRMGSEYILSVIVNQKAKLVSKGVIR